MNEAKTTPPAMSAMMRRMPDTKRLTHPILLLLTVAVTAIAGCARPTAPTSPQGFAGLPPGRGAPVDRAGWEPTFDRNLLRDAAYDEQLVPWVERAEARVRARLGWDDAYRLIDRILAHGRDADRLVVVERLPRHSEGDYWFGLVVRRGGRAWAYASDLRFPWAARARHVRYPVWGEVADPADALASLGALGGTGIWERPYEVFGLYSRGTERDWDKNTTYVVQPWLIHVYDRTGGEGGAPRVARYVVETPMEEFVSDDVVVGRAALASVPREVPADLLALMTAPIRPDDPDEDDDDPARPATPRSIEYIDGSDRATLTKRYAESYPARVALNAVLRTVYLAYRQANPEGPPPAVSP
jgi:hypothetical protein